MLRLTSPAPPQSRSYRFLDVVVHLTAQRPEVQEDFAQVYGALQVEETAASGTDAACLLTCLVETEAGGGGRVVMDGVPHLVDRCDPGSAYARALIFEHVAARSRSHLFLHAATVSWRGQGIAVAGPSGHGKSTLSRALAERGAIVLADDATPLDVASGMVSSFPQRGPGTALPAPVPLAAVFLLGSAAPRRAVRLAVDRWPATLARGPLAAGPPRLSIRQAGGHWEITADGDCPGLRRRIEAACQADGAVLLRDLAAPTPEFGHTAQLTRLTQGSGLVRLAPQLFGRGDRPPTELVWRLGHGLRQAALWALRPGPPAATAEAILRVVEGSSTGDCEEGF